MQISGVDEDLTIIATCESYYQGLEMRYYVQELKTGEILFEGSSFTVAGRNLCRLLTRRVNTLLCHLCAIVPMLTRIRSRFMFRLRFGPRMKIESYKRFPMK